MFTLLKKAALVGLGVTERAKEVLDDLSKKGEENQSDGANKLKSFLESGERIEAECNQKIEDVCKRVTRSVRIPNRADIERLEKGLADLAEQVRDVSGQKQKTH